MRANQHDVDRHSWPVPRTLPGADYHDAGIFDLERERIFHASWYCVGREEDVPTSGYVVVDVAAESILLVRDKKGDLRAFFNACRGGSHLDGTLPLASSSWLPQSEQSPHTRQREHSEV